MPARQKERIYIFGHWTGALLALTALLIFFAGAILSPESGAFQVLVASLVAVGLVILLQTNENLRGVQISRVECDLVEQGQAPVLLVHLFNAGNADRVALRVQAWRGWKTIRDRPARIPVLAAGESAVVRLTLKPERRGLHPVPTLIVSSIFPAGLCFSWKVFSGMGEFAVYPRAVGVARNLVALLGDGEKHSVGFEWEDVTGHRPYQPGDLLSRMDWKVFARRGDLLVREREKSMEGVELLRWADTAFLEDEETRLEQLSFWLEECKRKRVPFVLELESAHGLQRTGDLEAGRRALAGWKGMGKP